MAIGCQCPRRNTTNRFYSANQIKVKLPGLSAGLYANASRPNSALGHRKIILKHRINAFVKGFWSASLDYEFKRTIQE
jgi:hypothetical protein